MHKRNSLPAHEYGIKLEIFKHVLNLEIFKTRNLVKNIWDFQIGVDLGIVWQDNHDITTWNTFCITGHLCGESTSQTKFPHKDIDVNVNVNHLYCHGMCKLLQQLLWYTLDGNDIIFTWIWMKLWNHSWNSHLDSNRDGHWLDTGLRTYTHSGSIMTVIQRVQYYMTVLKQNIISAVL